MSLKHGLLGLLNYESMTGYELNKKFNGSLGHFWQAKASQIYRELDAMEQSGWLVSERVIQDEKPNKRVYSITPQGKTEFINWLSSLDPMKHTSLIRSPFLMRVFFGGELSTESTLGLIRIFREAAFESALQLQEIINELNNFATYEEEIVKNSKYWKLTALYGEIMCKANVEWAERAIAILEEEEQKDENFSY